MSTDNASYNFRSTFKDTQVDYIAALRDSAFFNLYGIPVTIKIPKDENNVDEYINYKDEDFYVLKTVVVPKFDEYRQVLSRYGMSAEPAGDNYPLEVLLPSAVHVPRNSRIILNEWNAYENNVSREWKVESTVTKQLSNSKSYTRIAYCVPARVNILVTGTVEIGACYIEGDAITATVYDQALANAVCICQGIVDNTDKPKEYTSTAYAACTVKYKLFQPSILY